MKIFDQMPSNASVWIYASPRILNQAEIDFCKTKLEFFISNWQSHGQDIVANYQIVDKTFIVIAADQSKTSVGGCSIDKSVHQMQELSTALGLDFLNRNVFYEKNGIIKSIKPLEAKKNIESNEICFDTLIYNTQCTTVSDFCSNFKVQASNTWLKKYFVPIFN